MPDDIYEIDVRGHKCPVPTLRLQSFILSHPDWKHIILRATDPMARIDIAFYCSRFEDVSLNIIDDKGVLAFTILRGRIDPV